MTEIDLPGPQDIDSQEHAWAEFEERLTAYLQTMGHVDDHLILSAPDGDGVLAAPYAQVDVVRPGELRGEVSGPTVLEEVHRLDESGLQALGRLGWEAPAAEQGFPNHHTLVEVDDAEVLARMIRLALGDVFGLSDPELLSYHAWGPAADDADALGLVAASDLPTDLVARQGRAATMPDDRDALLEMVGETLTEVLGHEVDRDEDDDFLLDDDHLTFVRVRSDEPTIEIFTRLVHGVDSRRRAALEIALLNRDARWSKFSLADRAVFMTVSIPGAPYCPEHLAALLPRFRETVLEVRDDLALRTGAVVG